MTVQIALAFVLLLASSTVFAEIIHWQPCSSTQDDPVNCTIHQVKVNPCKEADQRKPCKIKRGINAGISFDFTANFNAATAESQAYWSSTIDLPFLGMDKDACNATQCPIVKGEKRNYSIDLPIANYFPLSEYDVKWKLTNDKEEECCFKFKIKLIK